ncbi:MAG: hypothetical protein JWP48_1399 [Actinoallomurus sp.]|jgi:hypothetical protein|nr:hypothetical protein [Actinoallomurus sp.]
MLILLLPAKIMTGLKDFTEPGAPQSVRTEHGPLCSFREWSFSEVISRRLSPLAGSRRAARAVRTPTIQERFEGFWGWLGCFWYREAAVEGVQSFDVGFGPGDPEAGCFGVVLAGEAVLSHRT